MRLTKPVQHRLWALFALLVLTLIRLVVAAVLPLTPDETYYFTWAQHLQSGYLDHPPMVALWIKLGTDLVGNHALGVRLLGPVSAALGSWVLYDTGNHLLPGRRFGLQAAAFFNATLMLGAGCAIMTPDTPLIFFWTCGLWALAKLISSGGARWWLVAGLCAGLMLFSKYTAVLFLAAVGGWAFSCRAIRPQLRTAWPWLGIILALLVFAPDIAWNATHGWASYFKQGGRVNGFHPSRALQYFAELIGAQTMLFTPLIAFLAGRGLWQLRHAPQPGARLLLWLTLLPSLVFLEHVLTNRVESNWPAIIYPSACLAAAACAPRRWINPALALGAVITAVVYLQSLSGFMPLPASEDTTSLQLSGWQVMAQQAAATHPDFITSDDYSITSEMAFYAPKDVKVVGFTPRWAYFNWPSAHEWGKTGLLITRRDSPCRDQIATLIRRRHGQAIMSYKLCRITVWSEGKILPRP